jgi:hypothetical protein
MPGSLMDKIFITFDDKVYTHSVGILMGTNCVLLLVDLYEYFYTAKKKKAVI